MTLEFPCAPKRGHTLRLKDVTLQLNEDQASEVIRTLKAALYHGKPVRLQLEMIHTYPFSMSITTHQTRHDTDVEMIGCYGQLAFMGKEGWETCSECGHPKEGSEDRQ